MTAPPITQQRFVSCSPKGRYLQSEESRCGGGPVEIMGSKSRWAVDVMSESAHASPVPKTAETVLYSDAMTEVWPEVSRRLRAFLASRGANRQAVEDITQEVGLRALAKQVPFEDAADLCRWAVTVARNLHVDLTRRPGELTDASELDMASTEDVAHRVECRIRLNKVLVALRQLSAHDRTAILTSLNTAEHRERSLGRDRVALHRARRRLLELVGSAWGAVGVIFGLGRGRGSKMLPQATVLTALTLPLILGAIGAPKDRAQLPVTAHRIGMTPITNRLAGFVQRTVSIAGSPQSTGREAKARRLST